MVTLITIDEAKAIVSKGTASHLASHLKDKSMPILDERYLEAEYCWMFFKSPQIEIPPEANLGIKWAYVVSKRGNARMIQDFSYDPVKLHEYLQTMSNHFKERGE